MEKNVAGCIRHHKESFVCIYFILANFLCSFNKYFIWKSIIDVLQAVDGISLFKFTSAMYEWGFLGPAMIVLISFVWISGTDLWDSMTAGEKANFVLFLATKAISRSSVPEFKC